MQEPIAIDAEYLTSRLKALLAIPSPTGFTDEAVRYTARELESLGLEVKLTRRGAICARRAGTVERPARGIVSHLDTLGAQVKALKAEAFWSFTLYDNQTRSMLQTPQKYPRAGSQNYPSPIISAPPSRME